MHLVPLIMKTSLACSQNIQYFEWHKGPCFCEKKDFVFWNNKDFIKDEWCKVYILKDWAQL